MKRRERRLMVWTADGNSVCFYNKVGVGELDGEQGLGEGCRGGGMVGNSIQISRCL